MDLPKRKPTRLRGFDYSSENYYFITICTHNRQRLFGCVGDGLDRSEVGFSEFGRIADEELRKIPVRMSDARIDKYVIMPDHIHAILVLGCNGDSERSRPFPTLSTVVGLLKSGVSRRIHGIEPGIRVWQKSFYDKIIRDEQGYLEAWEYMDENPHKFLLHATSEEGK